LRPTTTDTDEAAEVIRTAFAAQSRPTSPPSSALLIAATLWRVDGDALHVARVSVAPRARGRGLAGALLSACEAEAKQRRVDRMTLKVRLELPENGRLFERCGFVRPGGEAHAGFGTPTTAAMEKVLA
jgi:GNAT superfamily N-acetyltransferase